jgi:hypothetical protein
VPIPAIPIIPDLLFYPFFNVVFDSTFFRVRQSPLLVLAQSMPSHDGRRAKLNKGGGELKTQF